MESSATQQDSLDARFPCSLVVSVPFPDARLASIALRALRVDEELSPLVHRSFSLSSQRSSGGGAGQGGSDGAASATATATTTTMATTMTTAKRKLDEDEPQNNEADPSEQTILITHYRATTDRMLRVSVNGFFESLGVVLQVMQELDTDVLTEGEGGQGG